MCSACGYPAMPGHWTDAGTQTLHDKLRARHKRAQILNSTLKRYGLRVHDDLSMPGMQVYNFSGLSEIVKDLNELWQAAERMTGLCIDPLDARFLNQHE
jgi:1-aminocyclopropane-1-carboxylate deaminase/D-cysteine desulfhydrase-like pyridoxal-dependent ACC family enzyme